MIHIEIHVVSFTVFIGHQKSEILTLSVSLIITAYTIISF